MRLPATQLPGYAGVQSGVDYTLVRLEKVEAGTVDASAKDRLAQQLSGGLGQAGFHLLLAAAEDVAEDAGAIAGGTTTTSAQHRTEHAAQVQAAVVVLQRAEQGLRPLRLRGVVAQRAHQHRQRGADRAGGLGIADAELLRHLLQRSAQQFGEKFIGQAHQGNPRFGWGVQKRSVSSAPGVAAGMSVSGCAGLNGADGWLASAFRAAATPAP
ncbi:hypothetical protein G6F31_017611 [Rhizopus arrhizus]|nr:hypothetical protein G6F31_017611 [Rhizopus arrhizus]